MTCRFPEWYLACFGDDGEVVIGYRAQLRYGAIAFVYASCLSYSEREGIHSATSLRATPAPVERGGEIVWSAPTLGLAGRWRGEGPAVERTLWSSERGDVRWRCVLPGATVEVERADGRILSGLGYAEHLKGTAGPWALPIERLLWGRFVAAGRAMAWIDWRGEHTTQLCLADGCVHETAEIDEQGVRVPGAGLALELAAPVELRSGAIGKTALSVLPEKLRAAFPGHPRARRAQVAARAAACASATIHRRRAGLSTSG